MKDRIINVKIKKIDINFITKDTGLSVKTRKLA